MSRDIKFRAWDKGTKQIFEVKQIDFVALERNVYGFITNKSILGGVYESLAFKSFDDVELMQFTGIKDKHGKEIYEGDIVRKDDGELVEVVFFCGTFTPKLKEGQCAIITYDGTSVWRNGEIIGNIYENKDLLK